MPSIEDLFPKSPLPSADESETQELTETLTNIQIKEKEQEAQLQAKSLAVPYINLSKFPITQEAIALIPQKKSKELQVVCFFLQKKQARFGAVNPSTLQVQTLLKEIQAEKPDFQFQIYKISQYSFSQAFKMYDVLPKIKKAKPGLEIKEKELKKFESKIEDIKAIKTLIKKISVTDFIALIIAGALKFRATDIHLEPAEEAVKIRYRLDGVLYDIASIEQNFWYQALSRIKLLAKLKLNVTGKPQDGSFTIFLVRESIDVRIATLPTNYGEAVVIRLLMSSAVGLKFEDLGLQKQAKEKLENEIKKLTGLILTTGPTGSGKTTTLYAILNKLNTPDRKIITLEDPIEYKLKGINQSQVEAQKGYTFAKGLRSILRQDPNIIMVGEIRDLETAEVAIAAALTGHLVVSTLHTNSAAAAIPRLLSIGVKPATLGPGLNAAIAQRLVRRLCPGCKTEDKIEVKTLEKVQKHLSRLPQEFKTEVDLNRLKFYTGQGCEKCYHLGFLGRTGVYEVFIIEKDIQDLITKEVVTEKQLQDTALKSGMITMIQDGLLKAMKGITSVSEVERAVGL